MTDKITLLYSKTLDRQGTSLAIIECMASAGDVLDLKAVPELAFTEVLLISVYPEQCVNVPDDSVEWDSAGHLVFGSPKEQTKRIVFVLGRRIE